MFCCNSTKNCFPICNFSKPYCRKVSYNDCNSKLINYYSSNCYRPLQQLYKTIYTPINDPNLSKLCFSCICCPSERYKTTNMTYGNFYYSSCISTRKHVPINYDKSVFMRCYDNNNKIKHQSLCTNRNEICSIVPSRCDPQEMKYWIQPSCTACCPTDCCNKKNCWKTSCRNYNYEKICHCASCQLSLPCYSYSISTTGNDDCTIQYGCL